MDRNFFSGKTVLVMGLGRFGGGVDAAKFAKKAGSHVIVNDKASPDDLHNSLLELQECNNIEYVLGLHDTSYFQLADIVIVNPAVPDDNEYVRFARESGKLVTTGINLFFQMCKAQLVGVTGSNGKSTTTAMIDHLLRAGQGEKNCRYGKVWLGGNIGNSPLLSQIEEIADNDIVVLELSSFQTQQLTQIQKAPDVAVLTNLTPNHLDRHGTFENYCHAKEKIFRYQNLDSESPAVSVFCSEDEVSSSWYKKYNDQPGRVCLNVGPGDVPKSIKSNFKLPGKGNLCNLAQALAVARHFGLDDTTIEENISKFDPLPDRLELVLSQNGVSWYNDSISTTPQSTIEALHSFEQPKILIAGGYDKNIDFDQLGKEIARKAKAVILLGQCKHKILRSITDHLAAGKCPEIKTVDTLDQAVKKASEFAQSGDVVLLSPACASYDMFVNFQQRGKAFTELVKGLYT